MADRTRTTDPTTTTPNESDGGSRSTSKPHPTLLSPSQNSTPRPISTMSTDAPSTAHPRSTSTSTSNSNSNSNPHNPNVPASPVVGHRQSFAENLRGVPPGSPRHGSRHPSLSQQAVQELINNPPAARNGDAVEFAGRDWRTITVGEVVDVSLVRWVEPETSVEEATNVLVNSGAPNVVLIRESPESKMAIGTFDYNDLNAYLLLVVGLARPEEGQIETFGEIAEKGRKGEPIPLKDVKGLGKKEPLVTLPENESLTKAIEIFGSGIHRILVVKENTTDVIGILSQLRLMRFFWENRTGFPTIDRLYPQALKDLRIGAAKVFAINGDRPLSEALELMHNEGITSLPVLDNNNNVIGNISHVDVKLLTKNTSLPLLGSSCIHFISVILSERGMQEGKDPFPVFHVTPYSTLAHTVAKLIATRSHRMWIVEQASPASSGPPTPSATPAILPTSPPASTSISMSPSSSFLPPPPAILSPTSSSPTPPYTPTIPVPAPAISASSIPGATMSGRLSGVVSLTDILNLFARASGLSPHDPGELREARRRRSSSVSTGGGGFGRRSESVASGRSESLDLPRSGSGVGISGGFGGRR